MRTVQAGRGRRALGRAQIWTARSKCCRSHERVGAARARRAMCLDLQKSAAAGASDRRRRRALDPPERLDMTRKTARARRSPSSPSMGCRGVGRARAPQRRRRQKNHFNPRLQEPQRHALRCPRRRRRPRAPPPPSPLYSTPLSHLPPSRYVSTWSTSAAARSLSRISHADLPPSIVFRRCHLAHALPNGAYIVVPCSYPVRRMSLGSSGCLRV